jgi:hypothetical protein
MAQTDERPATPRRSGRAAEERGGGESFFAKAWRGGYPLWLSYWVIGVGGNMSFVALLAAIWLATAAPLPPPPVMAVVWIVFGVSVAWHGFVTGAIWRAGDRYEGPRIWPWLARFGCALGVPRLTLEALFIAGALR